MTFFLAVISSVARNLEFHKISPYVARNDKKQIIPKKMKETTLNPNIIGLKFHEGDPLSTKELNLIWQIIDMRQQRLLDLLQASEIKLSDGTIQIAIPINGTQIQLTGHVRFGLELYQVDFLIDLTDKIVKLENTLTTICEHNKMEYWLCLVKEDKEIKIQGISPLAIPTHTEQIIRTTAAYLFESCNQSEDIQPIAKVKVTGNNAKKEVSFKKIETSKTTIEVTINKENLEIECSTQKS